MPFATTSKPTHGKTVASLKCLLSRPLRLGALVALVTGVGVSTPALAQGGASDVTQINVLADVVEATPGKTFHLVAIFKTAPKWHVYWKNPGAGAAAPEFEVKAPDGFTVGEAIWPRPEVLKNELGDVYAYEGEIGIFIPITVAADASAMPATFNIDFFWAVCDDIRCMMGDAERTVTVRVANSNFGGVRDPGQLNNSTLKSLRAMLPTIIDDKQKDITYTFDGTTVTITGPAKGHEKVTFLPGTAPGVYFGDATVKVEDDVFTVTVTQELKKQNLRGRTPRLRGLIMLGTEHDDPCFEFDKAYEPTPASDDS